MKEDNIKPEIISTADGSHSLYLSHLDETYHSRHGARQESQHVFIENGLRFMSHSSKIIILEVGFGTGLNALLACHFAEETKIQVEFITLETEPLSLELMSEFARLSTFTETDTSLHTKLHQATWEKMERISDHFSIKKLNNSIQNVAIDRGSVDLIFYDAFGPRAQPEMWTMSIFEKLFSLLHQNGVFVTYCAKGQVRRDLESAGFIMERLPGPPGKREMLRGVKKF